MSYTPANLSLTEDKAYGVHSGSTTNFTSAARSATMDLAGDESGKRFGETSGIMRWDKRHKKYVRRENDDDGSKINGKRLVRGESGAKIAASFKSGRFEKWKKSNRIGRVARVGESEISQSQSRAAGPGAAGAAGDVGGPGLGGKRFRHKNTKQPKAPDKFREDYEKQKKKSAGAKERMVGSLGSHKELRSVDDIRKERNVKQKRQEKNARPRRGGKGGR
jgi:ATP-dependent RNA helicase DDX54/DBP10